MRCAVTDLVAAYVTADELDAPDWKALMREASDRIELHGQRLTTILDTPGAPELLAHKAANGCRVRILASHPQSNISVLLDHAGIEVGVLDVPERQTTYRFDDRLLVLLKLDEADIDDTPMLHLRRAAPGRCLRSLHGSLRRGLGADRRTARPGLPPPRRERAGARRRGR
jgi:hypothetical protein